MAECPPACGIPLSCHGLQGIAHQAAQAVVQHVSHRVQLQHQPSQQPVNKSDGASHLWISGRPALDGEQPSPSIYFLPALKVYNHQKYSNLKPRNGSEPIFQYTAALKTRCDGAAFLPPSSILDP